MSSEDMNFERLTECDLEHLEPLCDDLMVKSDIVYAQLVMNQAEHNALKLEYDRTCDELQDTVDKIEYIKEQWGE